MTTGACVRIPFIVCISVQKTTKTYQLSLQDQHEKHVEIAVQGQKKSWTTMYTKKVD